MWLKADEMICGYPARTLRDLFQNWPVHLTIDRVSNYLQISMEEAKDLLERLESSGFLFRWKEGGKLWQYTDNGSALRMATDTPINRDAAQRLIQDAIQLAVRINNSGAYLYSITCMVVFGSFLSDVETLSDLDLAIAIMRKGSRPSLPEDVQEQHQERKKICQAIKALSGAIHVHSIGEVQSRGYNFRVLMGTLGEA